MSSSVVKSVFGIIFSPDRSSILLIKRRDIPVWVLPGGGVEANETPEEAAIREVKEETHLEVVLHRKVALYLPPKKGLFFKPTLLFEFTPLSTPPHESEEAKEIAFFPLNALPKPLSPPFPEFIVDTLKGEPPIEKVVRSITLSKIFFNFTLHPILASRFIFSRLGFHINY